jgi:hypothetical protein
MAAAYSMLVLRRSSLIILLLGFLLDIPRCILHIAPGFLGFAFHLLRGTLNLGPVISSPFTYLTFGTSCRVVDCAFYSVFVHLFHLRGSLLRYCHLARNCARSSVHIQCESARLASSNNGPAARNQLQEKYDERNYKQNVDESTQRVGTDDSQQPQNQKDYKDCPKHALTSRGYALNTSASIDTTNALTPDRGPPVVYAKNICDTVRP